MTLAHRTSSWMPRKVWNCFEIVNGATPASGTEHFWDGDIFWVGPADLGKLSSRVVTRGERNLTEAGYKSCGTTIVHKGTIILSARAPIGHVAIAGNDLCFNQGCKGLVPNKDVFGEYAYWLVLALKPRLEAAGQGTTFIELSRNKLKDVEFLLPPLHEQRAIATFLDEKCVKLDEAVRIKEEQIALLRERRKILIQQAVTRGLNPAAPMKDSGIDWIGQIPAHWDVVPIMAVGDVIDPNPSHRNPEYVDEGFPFISTQEFRPDGTIEIDTPRRVSAKTVEEQEARCRFQIGSLVFSRKGTIGAVRILPSGVRLGILDSLCVINPKKPVGPEFLFWSLSSDYLAAQYGPTLRGAALPQLSVGRVRSLKVILPPKSEQPSLVEHITREAGKVDSAVRLKEEQIAALKEYKTCLINAAVTGKIKVA